MDLDFHSRFKNSIVEFEKVGEEYALAKAESWRAQELANTMLSQAMQAGPKEGSFEQRKLDAKNSESYTAYLKETAQLIYKENSLRVKMESAKMRFEGNRSLSSLEKATRNIT